MLADASDDSASRSRQFYEVPSADGREPMRHIPEPQPPPQRLTAEMLYEEMNFVHHRLLCSTIVSPIGSASSFGLLAAMRVPLAIGECRAQGEDSAVEPAFAGCSTPVFI